jgi:glycosyltransferase involved in cell wall biosynthesis
MNSPSVVVMMSVYNGSKFLREQIDSILEQSGVAVRLLIRDDGSTDDTINILSSYGDRIQVITGQNLGAAESFMEVAFRAPLDADYFAFSDADDVWQTDKLARGISAIKDEGVAATYASPMHLVTETMEPIGPSIWLGARHSFGHALVQGGIGGATSIMNNKMFRLFRRERPQYVAFHDHWMYLLTMALGELVFDTESRILYRQHGSNTLGAAPSRSTLIKRRLNNFLREDPAKLQAKEFFRIFGDDLDDDKKKTLKTFAFHDSSAIERLRFIQACPLEFNNSRSKAFYLARVAAFRT